jgi:hypothetical protein
MIVQLGYGSRYSMLRLTVGDVPKARSTFPSTSTRGRLSRGGAAGKQVLGLTSR